MEVGVDLREIDGVVKPASFLHEAEIGGELLEMSAKPPNDVCVIVE